MITRLGVRLYDAQFYCARCEQFIPKNLAIKKISYWCPECLSKLRTKSRHSLDRKYIE